MSPDGTSTPRKWQMTLQAQAGSGSRSGLRDRKKSETRRQLQDQALRLFSLKGFATTSVDEIAAAADVSRSTFFRYFGSKEAVLFAPMDEQGELFVRFLRDRPADEGPLTAYENALLALTAATDTDSRRADARMFQELIGRDAALQERNLALLQRWQERIARTFAARRGEGEPVRAEDRLAAAIGITVSQHVSHEWRGEDGPEIAEVIRAAFRSLRDMTN